MATSTDDPDLPAREKPGHHDPDLRFCWRLDPDDWLLPQGLKQSEDEPASATGTMIRNWF
jgi:hypothetical protein